MSTYQDRVNDSEYDKVEDGIPADGLYTLIPDDEVAGDWDEDFDLAEEP